MPTVYLGNTSVVVPHAGAEAVTHAAGEAPIFAANVTDNPHEVIVVKTEAGEPDRAVVSAEAHPDLGQQVTEISPPAGRSAADNLHAVVGLFGTWSDAPPAWVESDDAELEAAVAAHYGCPVGCPDNGDPEVPNHETWRAG